MHFAKAESESVNSGNTTQLEATAANERLYGRLKSRLQGSLPVIRNLLVFEIGFLIAYKYGMSLTRGSPAALWFPDAILLCALLLTPPRQWWLYLLASLPIRWVAGVPPGLPKFLFITGFLNDSLKACLAAWVLRRLAGTRFRIDNLRSFRLYLGVAVIALPVLSALAGAAFRHAIGEDFWTVWYQWFLGDVLANLVLTPALLYWASDGGRVLRSMSWKQFGEAALVSCILVATSYAAFVHPAGAPGYSPALLYAPIPVLLWSAVRFGPMGAASASAVVALISIFSVGSGRGPFSMHSPAENVLAMQLFLAVVAVPLLVLAIVLEERKKLGESLRASEERYALAASAGQVTVWEYDLETRTITFDLNLQRVLGFDCSELKTLQHWLDRIHPEDADRILANERFAIAESSREDRARESIRVPDIEYRMFHKDGSIRWLLTRSRIMRGNGSPFRVVGTTTDITERHRVEDELHLSQQKLRENYDKIRELAAKLMTAHEDERKRISRELHDEVSQRLVALTLALHNFRRQNVMACDSTCHLDEILENTAEVADQVHQLSRQLHPAVLEYAGLTGALQSFCEESRKRLGITVEFACGELPVKIPNEVALCVYRVSQEAIRNAAQHSGSKRFRIELCANDHVLQLSIRDWGQGFDPSTVRRNGGLGLISMEERVRLLGGVFQLTSIAGSGTEIRAEVPVPG